MCFNLIHFLVFVTWLENIWDCSFLQIPPHHFSCRGPPFCRWRLYWKALYFRWFIILHYILCNNTIDIFIVSLTKQKVYVILSDHIQKHTFTFAYVNFLLKNLKQDFSLENIHNSTFNCINKFYPTYILLSISMYSVIYIGVVSSVDIRGLVKAVVAANFLWSS